MAVTLTSEGKNKAAKTDNYGDFELEGLQKNEDYKVKIEHKGYKSQELKVRTKIDVYLGDIVLQWGAR